MRLSESHSLPVPLADAWAALSALHVRRHALPGCKSLLEIAPDEFAGEMAGVFFERLRAVTRHAGAPMP